jgi:DNA-binding NtrC family response regulator
MPYKIYFLDDEEAICENFYDSFEDSSIAITIFTDPLKAIMTIKTNPPDLLFIDYRLIGITGDKVAQQLDPMIPKVLITGELAVKSEYKFNHVIAKPYKDEAIIAVINKYCIKRTA